MKIVYFAGKVSKGGGYRERLLGDSRVMSNGYKCYQVGGGKILYGGPFAIANDHGTYHGNGTHGCIVRGIGQPDSGSVEDASCFESGEYHLGGCVEHGTTWGFSKKGVIRRCIEQIRSCDAIHCYLNTVSCYGSLVELGYAAALAKPAYIYYAEKAQNWDKHFWFAMNLPNVQYCGPGIETSIHSDLLTKERPYKERYYEYLQSPEWDEKRKAKLKEADYRCQLCNANGQAINVHHRTYDRVFNELLTDLIALCEDCHRKFHNKISEAEGAKG